MKHKKFVICSVCGRKYPCEEDGRPKKHYIAPKHIPLGEIQYLTNPGWMGDQREVCPGSYELGDVR